MATSERRITRSQARCTGPRNPSPAPSASSSVGRPSAKKPAEGTPTHTISNRSSSLTLKETKTIGRSDRGANMITQSGRRILADLAGNDSPVIGLFPSSASLKSKIYPNSASKPKSRRALLGYSQKETSTPVGETLLRSQVQKLLQKDALRYQAPSPSSSAPSPAVGRSPSLLSASTSMNSQASNEASIPTPRMPSASLSRLNDVLYRSCSSRDLRVPVQSSPEPSHRVIESEKRHSYSKTISEITITESVRSGCDNRVLQLTPLVTDQVAAKAIAGTCVGADKFLSLTPLVSEVVDVAIATDVFLGKRVLQFDSPERGSEANQSSAMSIYEPVYPSANRVIEDDAASEWSMNVNVGSPEVEIEAHAERAIGLSDKESCTVRLLAFEEHVQKMQKQLSVSKVDLLWNRGTPSTEEEEGDDNDDDTGNAKRSLQEEEEEEEEEEYNKLDLMSSRNGTPYRKDISKEEGEEEEEEEEEEIIKFSTSSANVLRIGQGRLTREEDESECDEDREEEIYGDDDEVEEYVADHNDAGNFNNLCLHFGRTSFFEDHTEKRLPRGEGKHIRFFYAQNDDDDDDNCDEISEAMVVTGEEAMKGSIHLRGLPVHRGRHWRFVED